MTGDKYLALLGSCQERYARAEGSRTHSTPLYTIHPHQSDALTRPAEAGAE